jgi:hypothetical protein
VRNGEVKLVLVLDQWQEGHVNAAPARFTQDFKGETMNHEKLRKIVDQIGPKQNPEIDRDLEELVQWYLNWAEENGMNPEEINGLVQKIFADFRTVFQMTYEQRGAIEGFTVIYDDLEIGVGRQVFYLRSQAQDEASALAEFRDQFFSDANEEQWAWLLPSMRVHVGVFLPEYVKVFSSQPKALMLHWPDTPY